MSQKNILIIDDDIKLTELLNDYLEKYNFKVSDEEKYPLINTRTVEINETVANFVDFAAENGVSYKLLKDFNPWLRDTKLTNSNRKTYKIKIPVLK